MLLEVQKYLRSGKTLQDLKIEYGINYHETNGKICLNYDMIEAKEADLISQQCRGLILENNTWEVISCPMFRFFNYSQGCCANIDYNTAKYILKLDGTMLNVYYYKDKWFVGTRSRSEADVANEAGYTFAKLTEIAINLMCQTIKWTLQDFMSEADKNKTYIFELTSPMNQVCCYYKDSKLTLLAVRDKTTLLEEIPQDHLKYFNQALSAPEEYNFSTINDMLEVINSWNPKEKEGIVIRDANFNRIKVKNAAHVALSHMRDSLGASIRNIVEIILLGKDDDIISDMPDIIQNRIKELKEYIRKVKIQVRADYEELKDIPDMKCFASQAELKLWPAALYALKRSKVDNLDQFLIGAKKGKATPVSYPQTMIDKVLDMCRKLGYKDE